MISFNRLSLFFSLLLFHHNLDSPTNTTGEGAAGEMVIDSAASKFERRTVTVMLQRGI